MDGMKQPMHEIQVDDKVDQKLNKAAFRIVIDTLRGTIEWLIKDVIFFLLSLIAAGILVWTDSNNTSVKIYFSFMYIFLMASVMYVSRVVRDRQEAARVILHARGTLLDNEAYVQTLQGKLMWHIGTWAAFGLSILGLIIGLSVMASTDVGTLCILSLLLAITTFDLTKNIRDRGDADKWGTYVQNSNSRS